MIERSYSRYIAEHADQLARGALPDTTTRPGHPRTKGTIGTNDNPRCVPVGHGSDYGSARGDGFHGGCARSLACIATLELFDLDSTIVLFSLVSLKRGGRSTAIPPTNEAPTIAAGMAICKVPSPCEAA